MSYHHVCEHCDVYQDAHDYEHRARECYPKQIDRLRAEIERLRAALRWVSERQYDENADLDDICVRARRALEEKQ